MANLFGCHGNIINFEKGNFKKATHPKSQKQYDSNLVQMMLMSGQLSIAKSLPACRLAWLPCQQEAPIDL